MKLDQIPPKMERRARRNVMGQFARWKQKACQPGQASRYEQERRWPTRVQDTFGQAAGPFGLRRSPHRPCPKLFM